MEQLKSRVEELEGQRSQFEKKLRTRKVRERETPEAPGGGSGGSGGGGPDPVAPGSLGD